MPKLPARSRTPVAFARAIVTAYERRGIDPGPALKHVGLARDALDEAGGRIAIEPFEALSLYAMRELDDEALGWFSRRLPWGTYGMLLRASLTAPTLDIALRRWCRHHGLLTDDVRLELVVEGPVAGVRVIEQTDLGPLREFCLVSLTRNLHGVGCWLVDSRIALREARFSFPAPDHAALYQHMFHSEIAFGSPGVELRFDAAYLALPVVRDDAALRSILQQPIRLMARRYRRDRLLSQRIANHIADAGRPIDAEAVAAHFNTSLRSLQRHLKGEGTSLGALAADSRRQRAEELLLHSGLPLKRIARLLGYRDESTFGRAFLGWTGHSPAAFRKKAHAIVDKE